MNIKSLLSIALGFVALSSTADNQISLLEGQSGTASKPNCPVFSNVSYVGNDDIFTKNPLKDGEFYNPILQGCYPDPSICRKGDDYYLVCSSFAMFPGVPIFHSTDLVNWKQIGHVLDRESQLIVNNASIREGVYAPTIRYNPNNDTFYMITTQISGGFGNMMVKTKDPMKGWSDPIKLNFNGIDPSIFFDDNGKAYIVHNDAPQQSLWNGHRVIKIWEYDVNTDKLIPGTDKVIVNGGPYFDKHPYWIEAPHLYKKDGKYYLMCAEGGTELNHSEVVFMSDNVMGPYVESPSNPILTQRYLSNPRPYQVDLAGHADVVEGKDGKWYGVFLAVRSNPEAHSLTARETFMLPVDWSGTFPVFENGLIPIEPKLKTPKGVVNLQGKDGFMPTGNFSFEDNFTSDKLDYRWFGLRCNPDKFVNKVKGGGISLTPFEAGFNDKKPLSGLWLRQMHTNFEFSATLDFTPKTESEFAGLASVQTEVANIRFGVTLKDGKKVLELVKTWKDSTETLASMEIKSKKPIQLKIKAQDEDFSFLYSLDGTNFIQLGSPVKCDFLSTTIINSFTGNVVGLYCRK